MRLLLVVVHRNMHFLLLRLLGWLVSSWLLLTDACVLQIAVLILKEHLLQLVLTVVVAKQGY